MRIFVWTMLSGLSFSLAGCAAGGGGASPTVPVQVESLSFADFGTAAQDTGSNGLAFATGDNSHLSIGSETMTVRLIRIDRDPVTREIKVVLSDETVTLDPEFMTAYNRDAIFTAGSEIWDTGNDPQGIAVNLSPHILHDNIGQFSIRDITGGVDETYLLGYAVFGRETDPAMMPRDSGTITYLGDLRAQGFPSVNGGAPSEFETLWQAEMRLNLDLMDNMVSGDLEGQYIWCGGGCRFGMNGLITPTSLQGNGFASTITITECEDGVSCSGGGGIGGVFYDADAGVVAGLTQLDIQMGDMTYLATEGMTHDWQGVGFFDAERVTPN